jgi:hypothetical protein
VTILRVTAPDVERDVSGRGLDPGFWLWRVIADQTQESLHAFAALDAAAAGLIHLAGPLGAGGGDSVLYPFVGQRIAEADVHGFWSIQFGWLGRYRN